MEIRGAETDTAWELAQQLGAAQLVFSDEHGALALEKFAAVWCHLGDTTAATGLLFRAQSVAALSNYVATGHGLLLSGTAVALVNALGVDTLRLAPVTFGHDRAQAGLVPVVAQHPALRGLDLDRGVAWLTSAAYPAFAQLHPASAPSKGAVLAQTPGGAENPLLEYRLGQGRILVCGWHFSPLYQEAPRGYRDNFEKLIGHLLAYLREPQQWLSAENLQPTPRSTGVPAGDIEALALALDDLAATFKERYPRGAEFRERLNKLRQTANDEKSVAVFQQLRSEALLANPLLDFERLLLIKRGAGKLGLPQNYTGNTTLEPAGYDNEIAVLTSVRSGGKLTTLFRPEGGRFVGDLRLHFDADKVLFSMPDSNKRWQVNEINSSGSGLRTLPLIAEPDVDNYDACYLPDGRIIFTSTAPFAGVPCVRGSAHVANLFLLATNGSIRQLTVEQDHDWCPTLLPNGRVLYLRWEYTGIPHAFSRILFHMNPDGTEQMEFYGSNSYWPASLFYAKPLPGQPTKFVAIVGGHHELPRMGDLVIFDTAKGRCEAAGAMQKIPGRGRKVEPVNVDLPIAQTWPKFLHPFPLSANYFLVSCKPSAAAPWGIYLADVFDNLVPLCELPGYALFEPIPLQKTARPPVLADKVDLARHDAEIFLANIYAGPGLKGVPPGTIKKLRLVGYHFAYQGMGGEPDAPGMDGPWDVKRIIGTVPVNADGSARFRVPANTPIALQPLDAEGQAVQLMRSWFTAMPGETLSCVGCHEQQSSTPPLRKTIAATRPVEKIQEWYGPARGFDFRREVQPVLDTFCIGCHSEKASAAGRSIPNLTDRPPAPLQENKNAYNLASRFTPSYYELRRLVRAPPRESDMGVLPPWEFHADTTRLMQMLRKGHHGVTLDAEAWDRLVTWIDLNAPAHGTWMAICGTNRVQHQAERRRAMRLKFAGMDEDPETIIEQKRSSRTDTTECVPLTNGIKLSVEGHAPSWPLSPPNMSSEKLPDWKFDSAEARRRQTADAARTFALDKKIALDMVRIPAGAFVMGQSDGAADERPCCRVAIARPFWLGRFEITNEQLALFDPAHDSRLEHGDYIQFSPGERGWSLNRPKQPAVRISQLAATAFCRWLSEKTGKHFRLPTEAEWEWACRAGTATPLWYGTLDSDFSRCANVSDRTHQAIDPFGWSGRPLVIPPWRPAEIRFDDRSRVSAPVGTYAANPWGLCDMHGNVAEWTATAYRPYPYVSADGREQPVLGERIVVRGGSWYDKPDRCRSAFRQSYLPAQGIYDVGFRVVCDE